MGIFDMYINFPASGEGHMMDHYPALQRGRYVILGRAGMDLYPDPPGTSIEEASSFYACLGGSSANIAVAIARQGCSSSLVTTVSDDAVGRFCLRELDRYAVGREHVRTIEGARRTSLALAESRLDDHQCVLYRNHAADFQMTVDDVECVDYGRFDGLITTGTVFAEDPSRSAARRALELSRLAGNTLIFDIDYRPHSWKSAGEAAEILSEAGAVCDIVVGNDVEFDFMAGSTGKGIRLARELARSKGVVSVYKMGEKGAVTFTAQREFKTGVFGVKALKPIGAGDGFMGGFATGLSAGLPLEEAVIRGSASAAIVVSRVGCAPAMPDIDEVETFISGRPQPEILARSYSEDAHSTP